MIGSWCISPEALGSDDRKTRAFPDPCADRILGESKLTVMVLGVRFLYDPMPVGNDSGPVLGFGVVVGFWDVLGWSGLVWAVLGRSGPVWAGLGRSGAGLDQAARGQSNRRSVRNVFSSEATRN